MGFLRDGTITHGSGFEALHNALYRLDFLQRYPPVRVLPEIQKSTQRMGDLQVVHHRGVAFEVFVASLSRRFLKQLDGKGIVHVILCSGSGAKLVGADGVEGCVYAEAERFKSLVVLPFHPFTDLFQSDTFYPTDRVGEIAVNHFCADPDALKDLSCLIRLNGGDPHLGSDLHNPRQNRSVIIIDGGTRILVQHVQAYQLFNAFLGQIGIDGLGAIAKKRCEMMNGSGLRALQNQGEGRAFFAADQVLLYR